MPSSWSETTPPTPGSRSSAAYIAAINIEATFHGLITADDGVFDIDTDSGYVPFDGIVLTDTFHLTEDGVFDDMVALPGNSERARAQRALDIRVIIGNPPYSVGQTTGNDNNANLRYSALDAAIAGTYARYSTAQAKGSLYDSYIRAFRWASDRIKDEGVIGFVSNGGYIDANTADGFRKSLAAEFTSIYVFNLRGNARASGELRRREKDSVFGQGARTTISITLLVKNMAKDGPAQIYYRDIGDYLDREGKLAILAHSDIRTMDWCPITANTAGDWINQRNDIFQTFQPLSPKEDAARGSIFDARSAGLQTNRDAWVYNYSSARLRVNVERTIEFYNEEMVRFAELRKRNEINATTDSVANFISNDPLKISWSRSLKSHLLKSVRLGADGMFGTASYRPFSKQFVYYDRFLNHERAQLPRIFPTVDIKNFGIMLTAPGSHYEFTPFITDCIPDQHLLDTGRFFPRYTFGEADPNDLFSGDMTQRIDNISDRALAEYQSAYGAAVSKDDIFYYVYGLLHSPEYRAEFAADLRKMLPRAREFRRLMTSTRSSRLTQGVSSPALTRPGCWTSCSLTHRCATIPSGRALTTSPSPCSAWPTSPPAPPTPDTTSASWTPKPAGWASPTRYGW
jgi:predicted helicase